MQKLSNYLKSGGYLVIVHMLDQTQYFVGTEYFYSLAVSKEEIESALEVAGFEKPKWYLHIQNKESLEFEFYATGWSVLCAKKK